MRPESFYREYGRLCGHLLPPKYQGERSEISASANWEYKDGRGDIGSGWGMRRECYLVMQSKRYSPFMTVYNA